jgi:hypothetical protein
VRRWVEIEREGRTIGTFVSDSPPGPRSHLPLPYVISDTMDAVEQVDGKFYTSKSEFRAVGKALGLIEVGNEKLPPRARSTRQPGFKEKRRQVLKTALEKVRAGHYERYFHPDGTSRRQRGAAAAASTDRSQDT